MKSRTGQLYAHGVSESILHCTPMLPITRWAHPGARNWILLNNNYRVMEKENSIRCTTVYAGNFSWTSFRPRHPTNVANICIYRFWEIFWAFYLQGSQACEILLSYPQLKCLNSKCQLKHFEKQDLEYDRLYLLKSQPADWFNRPHRLQSVFQILISPSLISGSRNKLWRPHATAAEVSSYYCYLINCKTKDMDSWRWQHFARSITWFCSMFIIL
jgi:hypothetical protein